MLEDISKKQKSDYEFLNPEELEEPKKGTFFYYLIEGVYIFILVVTIVTWTIFGLIVWLPLLFRTTTIFAGTVFYASLFRDQARVIEAQKNVFFAVRFYIRGFKHFLNFYKQRHQSDELVGLLEPLSKMQWQELLVECIWVFSFWIGTYLILYIIK